MMALKSRGHVYLFLAVMDGPSLPGSQSERDRKIVSSPARQDTRTHVHLSRGDAAAEHLESLLVKISR